MLDQTLTQIIARKNSTPSYFVSDAQGFCIDTIATKFSSLQEKNTNQRKFIEKKKAIKSSNA